MASLESLSLDFLKVSAEQAWSSLERPSLKNEAWRYTNLNQLYKKKFKTSQTQPNLHMAGQNLDLVKKLDVFTLNEFFAETKVNDDLKEKVFNQLFLNEDPSEYFYLKNLNENQETQVIYFHKGFSSKEALFIDHITSQSGSVSYPHLVFILESQSQVNLIESFRGVNNQEYQVNAQTHFIVGSGATLNYCKNQSESEQAYHFHKLTADVKDQAQVDLFNFSTGSLMSRQDVAITIDGQNADVQLNGFYWVDGKQQVDNYTLIHHLKESSKSRQLYKGVLDGSSRAVFNGKIKIEAEAQKTDSSQMNKTLLLSNAAEIDTKPELEVYADDVKANHGAATGRIDESALFYLQSRAIDKNAAYFMLARAFVDELAVQVRSPVLRDHVFKLMSTKLKRWIK